MAITLENSIEEELVARIQNQITLKNKKMLIDVAMKSGSAKKKKLKHNKKQHGLRPNKESGNQSTKQINATRKKCKRRMKRR